MSTYTGVMISGTEVESYRNHHDTWFLRHGDRIRENVQRDQDGDIKDESFIGYRASAASIRKRMTLSGIDMSACEQHFNEHLQAVTGELEEQISYYEGGLLQPKDDLSVRERVAGITRVCRLVLEAIKDTCLTDWITAFPVAARLQKEQIFYSLNETYWSDVSSSPLVNAMLSGF
ncbi:HEPN/Toprim-associated domain-containing protein [Pantoea agglomerans]|uniref:HEPN/Toprim-associated domain-containing protein n=1 Tax=Enterobacter agglomerans TaxID=549 RepID=UPI003FD2D753